MGASLMRIGGWRPMDVGARLIPTFSLYKDLGIEK
jgi:hypothetical protein